MLKGLRTDGALKGLDVTEVVYCRQMRLQVFFPIKCLRADVTKVIPDATLSVNSSHVRTQTAQRCKLPAADVTRVLGIRPLWSRRGRREVALSACSADVSVDCHVIPQRSHRHDSRLHILNMQKQISLN